MKLTRREMLKLTGGAGAALALGVGLPACARSSEIMRRPIPSSGPRRSFQPAPPLRATDMPRATGRDIRQWCSTEVPAPWVVGTGVAGT